MIRWKTEWQTTPVFLLWEAQELCKMAKRYDTERRAPHSTGWEVSNIATGEEWRTTPNTPERVKPCSLRSHPRKPPTTKIKTKTDQTGRGTSLGVQWFRIHCQGRGHRLTSSSGKIPHAVTTTKSMHLITCACAKEPRRQNHHREKPSNCK